MEYRTEHDSMGEVAVPKDALYGAQTQRSLTHFPIGKETMPAEIIRAFAILKSAAAEANFRLGNLPAEEKDLILTVCGEILDGRHDGAFPLSVWQTGSGTQSNMNVNEVIANRGNGIAGRRLLHPNDTVNRSQSSNDTFPAALHIAAACAVSGELIPAVREAARVLRGKEEAYRETVKIGRTHLMDAVPLTFGQEISGWRCMLEYSADRLEESLRGVYELALGGTAVGTGLNAPAGFPELAASLIAEKTGLPFVSAPNKFHALTSRDALCYSHGAMKALAADLFKIANDIRLLASGPRCGLGEISIPENEPGSSIMPGKVNPTQCEQVTMVAVQVMGNDTAIGMAASQGHFELNVFLPVTAYNYLQSARLLADSLRAFTKYCLSGIEANEEAMAANVERSLMLVTALSPKIGYENAAKTAQTARRENITLKEAAARLGFLTEEEYDAAVDPVSMTGAVRKEENA